MENEPCNTEQAEVVNKYFISVSANNLGDVFISYEDNEILHFPMALSNI